MEIIKLYQDYGIQFAGQGERHYRENWIQVPCPFCTGNPGNHLGYNLQQNYFNCHRCGFKTHKKVIAKLIGISEQKANQVIRRYKGFSNFVAKPLIKTKRKQFKTPTNDSLYKHNYHCKYLRNRGFLKQDIQTLIDMMGVRAIGRFGMLDKINYRYRLFMPIIHENQVVSWQTRDCTNKAPLKYLSCPSIREKIKHKDILYRYPKGKKIILCEGVFDVWKVFVSGFHNVSCGFGVDITPPQIMELINNYNEILIWFDPDQAGERKAKKLAKTLWMADKECSIIKHDLNTDPGAMTKKEIKSILKGI